VCGNYMPPETVKAFIVETTEALEIREALSRGFQEKNISVCNVNPAIVATLKRRFPGVTTYGCDAETALRRAYSAGDRFGVVSLDLCGPISHRYLLTLDAVRPVLDGIGVVGMTMLRGREPSDIVMEMDERWKREVRRTLGKGLARHVLLTERDYMRVLGPWARLVLGACSWGDPDRKNKVHVVQEAPGPRCRVWFRRAQVYSSGRVSMFWLALLVAQPIQWAPSGFRGPVTWSSRPCSIEFGAESRPVRPTFTAPLKAVGFRR
jgi:hypothetical protein